MNINQIRYVLEVAASQSMREAASKLFVSQPALSASIKELEEELEIVIFERTNKGISLTDAGRNSAGAILPHLLNASEPIFSMPSGSVKPVPSSVSAAAS